LLDHMTITRHGFILDISSFSSICSFQGANRKSNHLLITFINK